MDGHNNDTSKQPLLSVENMSVGIPVGETVLHAVRDISFDLCPGETLGIVGESGSGKSMSALAIMGLLPKLAEMGTDKLELCGHNLKTLTEKQMAKEIRGKRISMIFQEPMTSMNPVYSIGRQMIETMLLHQDVGKEKAIERAINLLDRVGIPNAANRLGQYPHQFSGGQRQRIMIAMALMNSPELIIADEPTTALDVTIQAQILKLLKDIQQEFQMAMILITHDLGVIARTTDRIAVMYAGEIVEMGKTADVLSKPVHPYTRGLLDCIPDADHVHAGGRLGSIPGIVPSLLGDVVGCTFADRCRHAMDNCHSDTPPVIHMDGDHDVRCPLAADQAYLDAPIVAPERASSLDRSARDKRTELAMCLQNIEKTFDVKKGFFGRPAKLRAVRGVSLDIVSGETLALVGESGCGKSTLAQILLGLLDAEAGEVMLNNTLLSSQERRAIAREVQPIFQDPYSSLNPRQTIGQIIERPLVVHQIDTESGRRKRVEEMMEMVGLPKRVYHNYPNQMSGGQRQRVAIARAIIMRPNIVVCDEPTSALDVSVQSQILNLLMDLRDQMGLTYLLITHDLGVVRHMADRVAVMYMGQVVEEGVTDDIFERPQHPYTKALLSSVLTLTTDAGVPDNALGQNYPDPTNLPGGCAFHPRCPVAEARCSSDDPVETNVNEHRVRCHLITGKTD